MLLIVLALGCTEPAPPTRDTGPLASEPAPDTDSPKQPVEPPPLQLCINEVMASNTSSWLDDRGVATDWIELHNPGTADVPLGGWHLTDDEDEPFRHPLPDTLVVPAGGYLLLYADGDPLGGDLHLPFQLAADGEEVGLYRDDGEGELIAFDVQQPDVSIARQPDCCADATTCAGVALTSTPGLSNATALVNEDLVPAGSAWRYHASATPPPVDWHTLAFDDTGWPGGVGFLGFGDPHVSTIIPWGTDPAARITAFQFRHVFTVEDPSDIVRLYVDLARDDGAAVYLNEVEVVWSNLPLGPLEQGTLASAPIEVAEADYERFLIPRGLLVEGTNVLAVDVRQVSVSSADLGFDLALVAERP